MGLGGGTTASLREASAVPDGSTCPAPPRLQQALSPCKGKFQSFGDCGTPPSLNPLMLILYDNYTQNTPLCQVSSYLDSFSLSYQRFCHFLQCAYGVSRYFSTEQWRYIMLLYSFNAQTQCASNDVRHFARNPTVQEKMAKSPSKTGLFRHFSASENVPIGSVTLSSRCLLRIGPVLYAIDSAEFQLSGPYCTHAYTLTPVASNVVYCQKVPIFRSKNCAHWVSKN